MSNLPVFPLDEPYAKHSHYSYLIPRALAQAISPVGEIRIEVCVDCKSVTKGEYLYVDLENTKGDKCAHLSLRPSDDCIVLNTMKGGNWGNGSSTLVPFHGMRFWRFELVLNKNGVFSVQFGGFTVCEFHSSIDPNEVCILSSNISARCVVGNRLNSGPIHGTYVDEKGLEVVLVVPSQLEILPSEIEFVTEPLSCFTQECVQVKTETYNWYIFSLATQNDETRAFRGQFRILARGIVTQIHESRGGVAVEVSWSDLAMRTSDMSLVASASWICQVENEAPEMRLVAKPIAVKGAPSAQVLRSLTPISEFIRHCSQHETTSIGLSVENQEICNIKLSYELIKVAEIVFDSAMKSWPQIEEDWQLILLDWWSAIRNRSDILGSLDLKTDFFSFVRDNRLQGNGHEEDLSSEQSQLETGPSANDLVLWNALRICAEILASSELDRQEVERRIFETIDCLPKDAQNWALLNLACPLVLAGHSELLNFGISDMFIKESITHSATNWQRSSILTVLASRGLFSECAELIESLIDASSVDLNFDAIYIVFDLARKHRIALPMATRLSNCLFELIRTLKFREFSGGRHVGLLKSLIEIMMLSKGFPNTFQDSILDFLDVEISSILEFWHLVFDRAATGEFGAISGRLTEMATRTISLSEKITGLGTISSLQSSTKILQLGGGKSENERLNMVHSAVNFQSSLAKGLPPNFSSFAESSEDTEKIIRLLAHPCFEPTVEFSETVSLKKLLSNIGKLQAFPELPFKSMLETVGQALVRGDSVAPRILIEAIAEIDNIGDEVTESILLDAMAWWSTRRGHDPRKLYSLVTQLIGRVLRCGPGKSVLPSIQSAASRLLAHRDEFKLDISTFYLLNNLEQVLSDDLIGRTVVSQKFDRYFSDTLVAIYTCKKYLGNRARECQDTWVNDLKKLGVPVLYFCGSGDTLSDVRFDEEKGVVYLPVGDNYEDLPSKSFEMFGWIFRNRTESFVLKIDDDCFLDVENFFSSLAYRTSHYFGRTLTARADSFVRTWHQAKSTSESRRRAIDTSPIGSRYADGGGGYTLSRLAMASLEKTGATHRGHRFRVGEFYEDKLIGDLLKQGTIDVSSTGYTSLQARRTHSAGEPVLQVDRTFYPNRLSGISIAHLDTSGKMQKLRNERDSFQLRPGRIWPFHEKLSLAFNSNQLELLGRPNIRERVQSSRCICICVVRNELTILPHFLAHYRLLGVDLFFFIDNLSEDGSTEFLLSQDDCVIFSAANNYSDSHYGVDWQRAVLDNFCMGKWVVLADADEFIVPPNLGVGGLVDFSRDLDASGYDACLVLMVDIYPRGPLEEADFRVGRPDELASSFDRRPVMRWPFNRGPFGNLESYVSSLRHRMMPLSPPQRFTAQKHAFFKYSPLISLSEGLHFAAGLSLDPNPIAFLHYKYSADFVAKARRESKRGQHFGGAEEYKAYMRLADLGLNALWDDNFSESVDLKGGQVLEILLRDVR